MRERKSFDGFSGISLRNSLQRGSPFERFMHAWSIKLSETSRNRQSSLITAIRACDPCAVNAMIACGADLGANDDKVDTVLSKLLHVLTVGDWFDTCSMATMKQKEKKVLTRTGFEPVTLTSPVLARAVTTLAIRETYQAAGQETEASDHCATGPAEFWLQTGAL